jgi:hypothetical protein
MHEMVILIACVWVLWHTLHMVSEPDRSIMMVVETYQTRTLCDREKHARLEGFKPRFEVSSGVVFMNEPETPAHAMMRYPCVPDTVYPRSK